MTVIPVPSAWRPVPITITTYLLPPAVLDMADEKIKGPYKSDHNPSAQRLVPSAHIGPQRSS